MPEKAGEWVTESVSPRVRVTYYRKAERPTCQRCHKAPATVLETACEECFRKDVANVSLSLFEALFGALDRMQHEADR